MIGRLLDTLHPATVSWKSGAKSPNGHHANVVQTMGPPVAPPIVRTVSNLFEPHDSPEDDHSSKKSDKGLESSIDLGNFSRSDHYDATDSAVQFPTEFMELNQISGFNFDFPDWSTEFPGMGTLPLGMMTPSDEYRFGYPVVDFQREDRFLPPDVSANPEFSQDSDSDGSVDSDDEGRDDVIKQISERMGSLQLSEDGELRYFGATSNLNLLDDESHVDQWHEGDSIRMRGQALIDLAGLGQEIDSALIDHLISLYFAWQDPSFHVVDRQVYEQERRKYATGNGDSTFYSETLTNTM